MSVSVFLSFSLFFLLALIALIWTPHGIVAPSGAPLALPDGVTALYIASQRGHPEVVRLLLDASADKDKAARYGATALFIASLEGHHEVVRLLLQVSADKDRAHWLYGLARRI